MQFLLFRWSLAYITTEMVVRAGRLAGRCRCNYHNVVEEGVAPRWYGNDVVQNETVTRALRTTLDNHAKSLFMLCYLHDLPYRSCYLIFHARVISPSIIILENTDFQYFSTILAAILAPSTCVNITPM